MKPDKINICRDPSAEDIKISIERTIVLYELLAKNDEQKNFAQYCRSFFEKHKNNNEAVFGILDPWSLDLDIAKVHSLFCINSSTYIKFFDDCREFGIAYAKNEILKRIKRSEKG